MMSFYPGISLGGMVFYFPDEKKYTVIDPDGECSWNVETKEVRYAYMKFLTEDVGKSRGNCSDNLIDSKLTLHEYLCFVLEPMGLLQEELDKFVIDYFENN